MCYFEEKNSNLKITVFLLLRIIKKLGFAQEPEKNKSSINFIKIFGIIEKYSLEWLMKIEWIINENIIEMKIYIENSLNNYIN